MFLEPGDLQNHRNEEKGKEEKREKAMVALLVFIMAILWTTLWPKKKEQSKTKKLRWKQKVLLAVTFSKMRLDIHSYI